MATRLNIIIKDVRWNYFLVNSSFVEMGKKYG